MNVLVYPTEWFCSAGKMPEQCSRAVLYIHWLMARTLTKLSLRCVFRAVSQTIDLRNISAVRHGPCWLDLFVDVGVVGE